MCALRLSDLLKPSSVQVSEAQFAQRADRLVLFNAERAKQLEADFTSFADIAATAAMCKLEVCLRDQMAGGNGHVPGLWVSTVLSDSM